MSAQRPRPVPFVLLLVVVGVAGLNLRAGLGSVPPLLPSIRSDLAINNTQAGLITSVAVLAIGLFAPLGQRLGARIGAQRATAWCLAALCVAETARLIPAGIEVLFVTTAATGGAMGAASSMIPALISVHAGRWRGLAMGVYTTGLAMGIGAAAALALPLERILGSWRASLGALGLAALAATILWTTVMVRGQPRQEAVADGAARFGLPWSSRAARLLTLFYAMQMLVGYGCMAWISPLYVSLGQSAQDAAGLFVVFQVVQVATMVGLPALSDLTTDRRPFIGLTVLCCCVGVALLLTAPLAFAVPAVALCGLGAGGGATLAFVLMVDSTDNVIDGSRLTAMSLLVGNVVGAASPLMLGAIKDLTGTFAPGLAVLLVASVGMLALVRSFAPGVRMEETKARQLQGDRHVL